MTNDARAHPSKLCVSGFQGYEPDIILFNGILIARFKVRAVLDEPDSDGQQHRELKATHDGLTDRFPPHTSRLIPDRIAVKISCFQ